MITGKNLFDPVSKVQTHELSHGQLFLCADCFWMRLNIRAFFKVNLKNISLTSYCVYILPKIWSHYIFEKRRKVKKSNQKIVKWNLELGTNSDDENITKEKDMKTFKSDFCNFTTYSLSEKMQNQKTRHMLMWYWIEFIIFLKKFRQSTAWKLWA